MVEILGDIIDVHKYPLDKPGTKEYEEMIFQARADLKEKGYCQLKNFITQDGLVRIRAQLDLNKGSKQHDRACNAWYTQYDPSFPEEHPRNKYFDREFAVLRDDHLQEATLLQGIYFSPEVEKFVAAVHGVETIYQSRDPYQALTVNIMKATENLHWHFDCNDCVSTIAIQTPEGGGELEFVCEVGRENYEALKCLYADQPLPEPFQRQLMQLEEGAFIFFRGGRSIHRVRPVTGNRTRMVAALQYDIRNDTCSDSAMHERIYGIPQAENLGMKKTSI